MIKETAQKIKEYREKHRYSKKSVYEYLGLSAQGYDDLEAGKYSIKLPIFIKICEFFEVAMDVLLPEELRPKIK